MKRIVQMLNSLLISQTLIIVEKVCVFMIRKEFQASDDDAKN
jgi:hypothetical protein